MVNGTPPWSYTRPVGMPLACTGRFVADIDTTEGFNIEDYISDDGYGDPDMGSQVYIGFPNGSASLSQNIPYENGTDPYAYWVYYFLYWAVYDDISVTEALNRASSVVYGYSFGDCPLRTRFTAYWWDPDNPMEDEDCTMAVYGNGNIHLKNYVPPSHSVAVRSLSGLTSGDINTSYPFSASAADSQDHLVRYTFDWGDGSPQTWTDWNYSYATITASHSWGSQGIYDVKVRAQCTSGVNSSWSSPQSINIGNATVCHWLTVEAVDTYVWCSLDPDVYIDEDPYGSAPVDAWIEEGSHYVEVDEWVWSSDLGMYCYFSYFDDGETYYYDNPALIPVNSDTAVTVWYEPY